jgi:hypothetical protein
MTLTHDDKTLIVAANRRVIFIDGPKLIAGRADAVLGYLDEPGVMGRVYANARSQSDRRELEPLCRRLH